MKHTPGEWYVDGVPGYDAPVVCTVNRRIARILYHLGSEDCEVDANARLIAAAPDLLEACGAALIYMESVIGYQEQIGGAISEDTLKVETDLQDAIVKATR